MKYVKVKLMKDDLNQLLKLKKEELELVIRKKYVNHSDEILKAIYGGLYNGFFEMKASLIKDRYETNSISGIMDFNVLKYFISAFDKVLLLTKKMQLDVLERAYYVTFYDAAVNIGRKVRDAFVSEYNRKPKTYLDNVVLKKMKPLVTVGEINIAVLCDEELENRIYDQLGVMTSCNPSDADLEEMYNKLKKAIAKDMINKFANEKGFGSIANKIYLGFYGKNAKDVLTFLHDHGCKMGTSVVSAMNKTQFTYYLTALKLFYEELSNPKNTREGLLRVRAYMIGNAVGYEFFKEKDMMPLDNLLLINKDHSSSIFTTNSGDIYEQTSLFEDRVQNVRRRKSSREFYEESKKDRELKED